MDSALLDRRLEAGGWDTFAASRRLMAEALPKLRRGTGIGRWRPRDIRRLARTALDDVLRRTPRAYPVTLGTPLHWLLDCWPTDDLSALLLWATSDMPSPPGWPRIEAERAPASVGGLAPGDHVGRSLSQVLAAPPKSARQASSWSNCWLNLLQAEERLQPADPLRDRHRLALRGAVVNDGPHQALTKAQFLVWSAASSPDPNERRRLREEAASTLRDAAGIKQWGADVDGRHAWVTTALTHLANE